jgi:DNA modification methylase
MDFKLYNDDCFNVFPLIPDKSVDAIICDLPYGTTACKWDLIIPLQSLWGEYKRIVKPNRAIVLFGSQPFTTDLIMSNRDWFKYELIWDKNKGCQPALSKIQPMKSHENIIVFGKGRILYNAQMTAGIPYKRNNNGYKKENNHNIGLKPMIQNNEGVRYPKTILLYPKEWSAQTLLSPTQKPVALMEYLIRTYTNENETVLDNCMGSGTTGVACKLTNRKFIGIEKEPEYFNIAQKRISETQAGGLFFNSNTSTEL